MNISISRDGSEIGEWTEDQVREFYAQGQLLPTDYYWKEGMAEWRELRLFIKPPLPNTKPALSQNKKESDQLHSAVQSVPPSAQAAEPLLNKKWQRDIYQAAFFFCGVLGSVIGIGTAQYLGKEYPTANEFLFIGATIGCVIGFLPKMVSRLAQNKLASAKYNKVPWYGAFVGGLLGLAALYPYYRHQISEAIESINKTLPKQLDTVTRADTVRLDGNMVVYHITYTDDAHPLTDSDIQKINPYLKKNLLQTYASDKEKLFRDHSLGVRYEFFDTNSNFLTSVAATPQDVQ